LLQVFRFHIFFAGFKESVCHSQYIAGGQLKIAVFITNVCLAALLIAGPSIAQTRLVKSVFGAGGLNISGPNFSVRGTMGQTLTGVERSGPQVAWIGFWYNAGALPPVAVDRGIQGAPGFILEDMYPNPISGAGKGDVATIGYTVPFRSHVVIELFSVLGEKVATLVDREWEAGRHTCMWPASGLPPGIYFYRLTAAGFSETKKAVVQP
jgi:hypothetical protein